MESNFTKEQQYLRAKKRVKDIKSFYIHLAVYCLTTPLIILINLTFVPQFHWFWFSVLGWGVGLLFHWLAVFGKNLFGFDRDWEERKIREIMEKESKRESKFLNK
jgi:hypothetical protein